jgi:hypothetical protein
MLLLLQQQLLLQVGLLRPASSAALAEALTVA